MDKSIYLDVDGTVFIYKAKHENKLNVPQERNALETNGPSI